MMRKDLEELVATISKSVPSAYQILYTNGDFLTEARYEKLMRAGLRHIVVTSHSGRSHPPRRAQEVHFPADMKLSNRGGSITWLPLPDPRVLTKPCFAPAEILVVGANGDVLLCHEDGAREQVMGNVMFSTLEEIWISPKFAKARELLLKGERRNASSICAVCTNFDLVMPGVAEHMWKPEVWTQTETLAASELAGDMKYGPRSPRSSSGSLPKTTAGGRRRSRASYSSLVTRSAHPPSAGS
jgi:GTP 3',8-cyclase